MPPRVRLPKIDASSKPAPTTEQQAGPSTRRQSRRTQPLPAEIAQPPSEQTTSVAPSFPPPATESGTQVSSRRTLRRTLPPVTAVPFAPPVAAAQKSQEEAETSTRRPLKRAKEGSSRRIPPQPPTAAPIQVESDETDSTFEAPTESESHDSDFHSLMSEHPAESSASPEPELVPTAYLEEESPEQAVDTAGQEEASPNSTRPATHSRRQVQREARRRKLAIVTAAAERQERGKFLLTQPLSEGSTGSTFGTPSTPPSSEASFADSATEGAPIEYPKFVVTVTTELLSSLQHFEEADFRNRAIHRRGKEHKNGQVIDNSMLDRLRVRERFEQFFARIGFNWMLNMPIHDVPVIIADEFFNSFKFTASCQLDDLSISFRLFGILHKMSLREWSVRLGIVSEFEVSGVEFQTALCGVPNKTVPFDSHAAWTSLTHPGAGQFKATQSRAHHLTDPVLRLCQTYLGYNLLGQTTCFSRISLAELYLVWCMHERLKVNLGFWVAHQIHLISTHPSRNLTLCHFLGVFLARNFELTWSSTLPALAMCPGPSLFDLHFLRRAGIVCTPDGAPRFYTPGETIHSLLAAGSAHVEQEEGITDARMTALEAALTEVRNEMASLRQSLENFIADLRETAGPSLPPPTAPSAAPPTAPSTRRRRAR